jgi:phospho-2-dehydro-3-deoxyheptonate aldolase
MAERAPTYPTNHDLAGKYPIAAGHYERVAEQRQRVSDMLGKYSTGLLAVVGPCAMTEAEDIMRAEALRLAQIEALYRTPFYKPRTNKKDWHGLETSNPEAAYRIMTELAADTANLAVEIGADPRHLPRYADSTTLAWKGGRNHEQPELTYALALHDPMLPVAIKNGLDGEIGQAMQDIERIEELRCGMGARAILLFRGGLNATSPEAWEEQYLLAHEATEGRLLVDWAHGGEQAHDPKGRFGKSVIGQIACMNHTIEIARRTGKVPAGIFAEATDAVSPTDPVMSFDVAIEGVQTLAEIKAEQQLISVI